MGIADKVDQAVESGESSVPATQEQSNVPATNAPTMSMDDFLSGAMNVDGYVKVDSYGIHFDDQKKAKKETIDVVIDTTEIQPTQVIRFGTNPPVYYKTYDGVSCTQGGTWQNALQTAAGVDPKAQPYKSADIPMELQQDYGNDYPAGTRLGHSLSPTNQTPFAQFWKRVSNAGLIGERVQVRVSYKEREKNGNSWGVLTFDLVGKADD